MAKRAADDSNFRQVVEQARLITEEELRGDASRLERLNEIEDFVYLKSANGVVVWTNQAYDQFYSSTASPQGRHGKAFLDPTVLAVAKHTDALILSGSDDIECKHVGVNGDGEKYLLRTYKLSLRYLQKPGYAILGVTRPLRPVTAEDPDPEFEMARLASVFSALEERDKEICRLFALGFSSGEIGGQLEMTGRNVDLRRKKCFDTLGVEKVVELTRLLTQLEERGYLQIEL